MWERVRGERVNVGERGDVAEETLCEGGESEGRESECGRIGRCSGGNTV